MNADECLYHIYDNEKVQEISCIFTERVTSTGDTLNNKNINNNNENFISFSKVTTYNNNLGSLQLDNIIVIGIIINVKKQ